MPIFLEKCVRKVSKRMKETGYKGNPYAICTSSLKKHMAKCHKCDQKMKREVMGHA